MKKALLSFVLTLICCGCSQYNASSPKTDKPNFIIVLIDDMGYGDIEPFGSQKCKTPHLNRMAEEGMKLTSFYAAPVCSPSRAALMTGCYPPRVGLGTGSKFVVLLPGDSWGLNPKENTIAELLKDNGYKTACIGKWHLGDQPEFLPTRHGFDYFYGLPYSNDISPRHKGWNFPPLPLLRNEKVLGEVTDQSSLTTDFINESINFIKTNRDKPFFIYLPHAMVHGPLAVSDRFKGKNGSLYADTVGEIDWGMGQIIETLQEAGIDENTVIVFTSDNGASKGGKSAGPLSGGKGSTMEGGMRVPTLVRWPGQIPAGSSSDLITSTMDLLPTFVKMAGGKVPDNYVTDGRDIGDILKGKRTKQVYDKFFYYKGDKLFAVRSEEWKLTRYGALFNLKEDIGEKKNVAQKYPEVAKRLKKYIEEGEKEMKQNARPVGVATGKLRFLIPRDGNDHSPVVNLKPYKKKKK